MVENPSILKAVYAAGHQIGLHTWSHRHLSTCTNEQIVAEVMWGARAVMDVIGVMPTYFRPPYGTFPTHSQET